MLCSYMFICVRVTIELILIFLKRNFLLKVPKFLNFLLLPVTRSLFSRHKKLISIFQYFFRSSYTSSSTPTAICCCAFNSFFSRLRFFCDPFQKMWTLSHAVLLYFEHFYEILYTNAISRYIFSTKNTKKNCFFFLSLCLRSRKWKKAGVAWKEIVYKVETRVFENLWYFCETSKKDLNWCFLFFILFIL